MNNSNNDAYIHSIYLATEGEGCLVGSVQVFVRFQGCAIGCRNCDSKETWNFEDGGRFLSIPEIVKKIKQEDFGNSKRVSITGGDPLHPKHIPHVLELIKVLKSESYFVNIEASGVRIVDEIFSLVDFISFDFKTLSTGVKARKSIFQNLLLNYKNKVQIKAVVANREDFDQYYDLFLSLRDLSKGFTSFVITPCYEPDQDFDSNFFQDVMQWNYSVGGVFRVIGQQHKWVFGTKSLKV